MTSAFVFITNYGIYFLLLAIPVILFTKNVIGFKIIVFSSAIAASLGWLIKNFYYLPRPYILSGHQPAIRYLLDGSFPSNHTAISVAIAVSVYLCYKHIGLLLILLAVLIGISRIVVGVHTSADVLAGGFIGLTVPLLIRKIIH